MLNVVVHFVLIVTETHAKCCCALWCTMFVHNMIDICQFQLLENYPEQAEILNEAGNKQDGV